jgi:hypothetical protein
MGNSKSVARDRDALCYALCTHARGCPWSCKEFEDIYCTDSQSATRGKDVRRSCERESLASLLSDQVGACLVATRVASRQRPVPGEHKDRHDHPCEHGEDADSSRQAARQICMPGRSGLCTPANTRKDPSRKTRLTKGCACASLRQEDVGRDIERRQFHASRRVIYSVRG